MKKGVINWSVLNFGYMRLNRKAMMLSFVCIIIAVLLLIDNDMPNVKYGYALTGSIVYFLATICICKINIRKIKISNNEILHIPMFKSDRQLIRFNILFLLFHLAVCVIIIMMAENIWRGTDIFFLVFPLYMVWIFIINIRYHVKHTEYIEHEDKIFNNHN